MREQPTPRTAQKSAVARQHILASALQQFAAHGCEATTMREVATQAGYSPGLACRFRPGEGGDSLPCFLSSAISCKIASANAIGHPQ